MSKLIVGNTFPLEVISDFDTCTETDFVASGHYAQGLLWSAEPGDVLVLPVAPADDFTHYALDLLGLDRADIRIVEPPPGSLPPGLLSPDGVLDPGFLTDLAVLTSACGVTQLSPYYYDRMSAETAKRLSLDGTTPGFAFVDEGGARLLNSKAAFRAFAAGAGLPIPRGMATNDRHTAADFAWELLATGRRVIVKQDYNIGGFGNEVLTCGSGEGVIGAQKAVDLADRAATERHFADSWNAYSKNGDERVVVEHYIEGCVPLYREMRVCDDAVESFGHGEMLMSPVYDGLAIPGGAQGMDERSEFFGGALRMAETVRAVGYRGLMSVDAIVTPSGEILFNEFNCRTGGSTHIHHIGARVVGGDYLRDRAMLVQRLVPSMSFKRVVERLHECGLSFDPVRRTGVILATDIAPNGKVQYCVVETNGRNATAAEDSLRDAFGVARTGS